MSSDLKSTQAVAACIIVSTPRDNHPWKNIVEQANNIVNFYEIARLVRRNTSENLRMMFSSLLLRHG